MSFKTFLKQIEVDETLTVRFQKKLFQLNPPAMPGPVWAVVEDKEFVGFIDGDNNPITFFERQQVLPVYPARILRSDILPEPSLQLGESSHG